MPAVRQPHTPDTFRRRVWPGERVPTAADTAAAGRPGSGGLHLPYLYSSPWGANTELGGGGGLGWAGRKTVPKDSKQYTEK